MHLDGFVELGELDFLEERNSLFEGIFARFYLLERSFVLLTWFLSHISSLVQAVVL
jgi:hypothetical protein